MQQDPIENEKERDERPRKNTAFGILLDIELAIVAVLFCALVVPRFFGIVPDVVLSPSMGEVAPAGSIAYLDTNIDPADLAIGDVAAYNATEDIAVLHRIVGIPDDGSFVFQGDMNVSPDAIQPTHGTIIGEYMFCIPVAGYVYMWVIAHPAFVVAMILAINLAFFSVPKLIRMESPRRSEAPDALCEDSQPID